MDKEEDKLQTAQELLKERTWDKIISDKVKELVDKNIVVLK